jgi:uncharacterized surface anchored protein
MKKAKQIAGVAMSILMATSSFTPAFAAENTDNIFVPEKNFSFNSAPYSNAKWAVSKDSQSNVNQANYFANSEIAKNANAMNAYGLNLSDAKALTGLNLGNASNYVMTSGKVSDTVKRVLYSGFPYISFKDFQNTDFGRSHANITEEQYKWATQTAVYIVNNEKEFLAGSDIASAKPDKAKSAADALFAAAWNSNWTALQNSSSDTSTSQASDMQAVVKELVEKAADTTIALPSVKIDDSKANVQLSKADANGSKQYTYGPLQIDFSGVDAEKSGLIWETDLSGTNENVKPEVNIYQDSDNDGKFGVNDTKVTDPSVLKNGAKIFLTGKFSQNFNVDFYLGLKNIPGLNANVFQEYSNNAPVTTSQSFVVPESGRRIYDTVSRKINFNGDSSAVSSSFTISVLGTGAASASIPLPGATFILSDKDNKPIVTNMTDNSGNVSFKNLGQGTYYLTESKAPNGYALPYFVNADKTKSSVKYTVSVDTNGKVTITDQSGKSINTIKNPEIDVTVQKYKADSTVAVDAGNISLYQKNSDNNTYDYTNPIATLTANNGAVTFQKVAPGEYQYGETKNADGYKLNQNLFGITVTPYGDVLGTTSFADEMSVVNLRAVDANDTTHNLAGATFTLSRNTPNENDKTIVQTITSDSNGKLTFAFPKDKSTYTIDEIVPPAGYKLTPASAKVLTIDSNGVWYDNTGSIAQTKEIVVKNEPIAVNMKIVDTSKNPNPLNGAVFEMIPEDSTNKTITATSDKDGNLNFAGVSAGEYTLHEKTAPDGFAKNADVKITVNADGTVANGFNTTIKNDEISFTITSLDKDGKGKSGSTITIYAKDDQGNYTKKVVSQTTDKDGVATFAKIPAGEYQYEETSTADGYERMTDRINITVKDTADKDGVFVIGQTAFSTAATKATIIDIDGATNMPINNAELVVTNSETGKVYGTYVSGESEKTGYVDIKKIPAGEYIVSQTTAPAGYRVSADKLKFTVDKDGKISYPAVTLNTTVNTNKNNTSSAQNSSASSQTSSASSKEQVSTNYTAQLANVVVSNSKKYAIVGITVTNKTTNASSASIFNFNFAQNGAAVQYGEQIKSIVDATDMKNFESAFSKSIPAGGSLTIPIPVALNNTSDSIHVNMSEKNTGATIATGDLKFDTASAASSSQDSQPKTASVTMHFADSQPIANQVSVASTDSSKKPTSSDASISSKESQVSSTVSKQKSAASPLSQMTSASESDKQQGAAIPITQNDAKSAVVVRNFKNEIDLVLTDADTGKYLAGGEFTIVDSVNPTSTYSIKSDESGKIVLTGLPEGTYNMTETKAPEGYVIPNSPYVLSVAQDGTFTVNDVKDNNKLTNKQTEVTLLKKDRDTGAPLSGAKFQIKNSNKADVYTGTTTDDGTITVKGLPIGKYSFTEVQAPTGYAKSNDTYGFSIDQYGKVTGDTEITDELASDAIQNGNGSNDGTNVAGGADSNSSTPDDGSATNGKLEPVKTGVEDTKKPSSAGLVIAILGCAVAATLASVYTLNDSKFKQKSQL